MGGTCFKRQHLDNYKKSPWSQTVRLYHGSQYKNTLFIPEAMIPLDETMGVVASLTLSV